MEGATLWPADGEEDGIGMGSSSNCRPFSLADPLVLPHRHLAAAAAAALGSGGSGGGVAGGAASWSFYRCRGSSTRCSNPHTLPRARSCFACVLSVAPRSRCSARAARTARPTPLPCRRSTQPAPTRHCLFRAEASCSARGGEVAAEVG